MTASFGQGAGRLHWIIILTILTAGARAGQTGFSTLLQGTEAAGSFRLAFAFFAARKSLHGPVEGW